MRYLSQCPRCNTVYQLSLMQMNISKGMARCSHCQNVFDAYSHFIIDPDYKEPPLSNFLTEMLLTDHTSVLEHLANTEQYYKLSSGVQYVNTLMSEGVDGSRLNLYTYLNHLDTLNPIHLKLPTEEQDLSKFKSYKKSNYRPPSRFDHWIKEIRDDLGYYVVWGIINLFLIILFVYQVIFFNYK